MTKRISIAQAPAWAKKLEGELHRAALRGLYSAGLRIVSVIQNEIIPAEPRVPVDRKIYAGGWRVEKTPDGCVVYNVAPHAEHIEFGVDGKNVKVGRAMIDALAAWVVRKGLTGDVAKGDRPAEGRRIAWAIAQSMKVKGIFGGAGKGLRILERAMERAPDIMEHEIEAEVSRV